MRSSALPATCVVVSPRISDSAKPQPVQTLLHIYCTDSRVLAFCHQFGKIMKLSSIACCAVFGCLTAPAAAFTSAPVTRGSLAADAVATGLRGRTVIASRQKHLHNRRTRATTAGGFSCMMAVDPVTVHALGEWVNVASSSGVDQAWLSHVMHGELSMLCERTAVRD